MISNCSNGDLSVKDKTQNYKNKNSQMKLITLIHLQQYGNKMQPIPKTLKIKTLLHL